MTEPQQPLERLPPETWADQTLLNEGQVSALCQPAADIRIQHVVRELIRVHEVMLGRRLEDQTVTGTQAGDSLLEIARLLADDERVRINYYSSFRDGGALPAPLSDLINDLVQGPGVAREIVRIRSLPPSDSIAVNAPPGPSVPAAAYDRIPALSELAGSTPLIDQLGFDDEEDRLTLFRMLIHSARATDMANRPHPAARGVSGALMEADMRMPFMGRGRPSAWQRNYGVQVMRAQCFEAIVSASTDGQLVLAHLPDGRLICEEAGDEVDRDLINDAIAIMQDELEPVFAGRTEPAGPNSQFRPGNPFAAFIAETKAMGPDATPGL